MYNHHGGEIIPHESVTKPLACTQWLKSVLLFIPYHLNTIWLFTISDFKTILGPCVIFAILQQLGSPSFHGNDIPKTQHITLVQLLRVILWTWLNLLPIDIDNQRRSILEDQLNKPWRPLPAKRITSKQATNLMLCAYPVAIFYGILTGAHRQSLALVCFGYWYNDLGGSKSSWFTRQFLNACGITCFLSGALMVMIQDPSHGRRDQSQKSLAMDQTRSLQTWIVIIWSVIFSSTQTQDMADQEGDSFIHRKTMPLVLGDKVARWTISVPVIFWSWFCLRYWTVPIFGCIIPMVLGALVAWRTLTCREVQDDKKTYQIWNLWLAVLFTLPLQRLWFM